MRGLIAVPHTGLFPYQFVVAWTQLLFCTRPMCEALDFTFIGSSLIYEAREQAAEKCVREGYDWLFFLDSDMEPRQDTIQRLLAWDKPIVSAMCFKRQQPYTPCFYPTVDYDGKTVKIQTVDEWTPGCAEVEGAGMACCLIKREVLEKTPRPWFFPMPILAEDLGFCKRAREAGFSVHVDTTLCCGHVGSEVITDRHYLEYRRVSLANRDNAGQE